MRKKNHIFMEIDDDTVIAGMVLDTLTGKTLESWSG